MERRMRAVFRHDNETDTYRLVRLVNSFCILWGSTVITARCLGQPPFTEERDAVTIGEEITAESMGELMGTALPALPDWDIEITR